MPVKNFISLSSDFLFIEDLEVSCRVGETKDEQAFPQILLISSVLKLSLRPAGKSDNIHQTLNYADFIKQVRHTLETQRFSLIERVAETIAAIALADSRLDGVGIEVCKK